MEKLHQSFRQSLMSLSANSIGYIKLRKAGCRFSASLLFLCCETSVRRDDYDIRSGSGLEYHIKVNEDMIGQYVIMPGILRDVRR